MLRPRATSHAQDAEYTACLATSACFHVMALRLLLLLPNAILDTCLSDTGPS